MKLVITCEHGGNDIPDEVISFFQSSRAKQALASHRGYDPGALATAIELASATNSPLFTSTTSRLVVDLNRSLHHRRLFSEFTRELPPPLKQGLIDKHYAPYRNAVTEEIRRLVDAGERVVHVSVHSFTPVFAGVARGIDVGWLYDPARCEEKRVCGQWLSVTARIAPDVRLRRNAPYKGTSDGFTKQLRQLFPDPFYAGIELELSQAFCRKPKRLAGMIELMQQSLNEIAKASTGPITARSS